MSKDEKIEEGQLVEQQENLPAVPDEQPPLDLISDEALLGVYGEIMDNLRSDRDQFSELTDTFAEMVINEGDSSTSSKEALVNLAKAKMETADRMAKIADLMTRIKLKQPDTFKPYMKKEGQPSGNTINIYDTSGLNKRALLEALQKGKEKRS